MWLLATKTTTDYTGPPGNRALPGEEDKVRRRYSLMEEAADHQAA